MVTYTNQQGYSRNDGPTQYRVRTTQPMYGSIAAVTGSEGTIFQYDLVTQYGLNKPVANAAQTTRVMVGLGGLTILLGLLTAQNMTLRIYANGGINTTFTEVDTSPVAVTLNAKWQYFTLGPFAASHIRGTLQAGTNATVEYHVRLLE